MTGLIISSSPILRFENSEEVNLQGESILDMSNVPFQYAEFENCGTVRISNLKIQSQKYESPFTLMQFHSITTLLVMENVTISDVEFANKTHFIRLVDANEVQLKNFVVDQVLLDSYLIWLSQLRKLTISK